MPWHFYKVLNKGKIAGVKLDLEENLKIYYKLRGWDWETGRPTEEKLKELRIIQNFYIKSTISSGNSSPLFFMRLNISFTSEIVFP